MPTLQALIQALYQHPGGPDGAAAEIAAAGSVAPPSESMLPGDHGRRWQGQNVKQGGLLDEALALL